MGNDKMRDEFEAWVLDKWPQTDLGQFNDGEYCGFTLQHCWAAWQASRAAVVVELPGNVHHTANGMRRGCQAVIEAAGLRVQP